MPRISKSRSVTAGIGTVGNAESLCLTLQSILFQDFKPSKVIIYDCSESGVAGNFYLQQLIQIGVILSIDVQMKFLKKIPIGEMYQKMLDDCDEILWLVNDDVAFDPSCLDRLRLGMADLKAAAVCGTKPDITNGRRYKDWSRQVVTSTRHATPFTYNDSESVDELVPRFHMDLGNCLIDCRKIKDAAITFIVDAKLKGMVFGEDWIFGARCEKAKLKTYLCTSAKSYHLDKPDGSPYKTYGTEQNLLRMFLRDQGLPEGVLKEWGAS